MNRKIQVVSVRVQAYEQMKNMILDGLWEPGSAIDLGRVAAEFGVSKTPLNEAIQMLVQEGLVSVKPRSGTFVSVLSMDEIAEAFDFRLALEVGAAEAIVGKASADCLASLQRLHEQMQDAVKSDIAGRRKKFLRLDMKFHDVIMESCGNQLILSHYRQVNSLSLVSRGRGEMTDADYGSAMDFHVEIMAALKAGDVQRFRLACRDHVEDAKTKLAAAIQRAAART